MPKPAKGQPGPITLAAQEGQATFTRLCRPFFRQCSQPAWMKLAQAATGDRVLHSSQIAGFSTGELQWPAPKVFVALGTLNTAIADGTLPGLKPGMKPMALPDGTVLDAVGMFQVFSGMLPVDLPEEPVISEQAAPQVSEHLGAHLRRQFGAAGIDFAVSDRDHLVRNAPVLDQLLAGRPATGEAILADLPKIAWLLGCGHEDLRDVVRQATPTR